ncbi:MAG: nucleotidyltransferase domain-containing protein [Chlorobium sp.]|jgi:predicted nucleotidyltransferase|nr:nucleotidyltransferase domain-containing protein [Chlorobium sp.]
MDFGLLQQDMDEIIDILQKFPGVEEAILFGSRAKGTYKKGSDIDIAIKGKGIDHAVVASLAFLLNEESAMPYFFDIVHFDDISEQELMEHINRVGRCIYLRESGA